VLRELDQGDLDNVKLGGPQNELGKTLVDQSEKSQKSFKTISPTTARFHWIPDEEFEPRRIRQCLLETGGSIGRR
jgi:hypothetical protein